MKNVSQSTSSTVVENSSPDQSGTGPTIQPVVTDKSSSSSVPQPETRSIPPKETRSNPSLEINVETRSIPPKEMRSNPSLETKVDTVNGNLQSSFPAYPQDVNSTQSPLEEYQLTGVSKL